jgi:hypothetical protein
LERATARRKVFELEQKAAHRRLRQIGIGRADGGAGAFTPGFVNPLAAQCRFHHSAETMDRLSVPMEEPAADFNSVAETDPIRERIQMEKILPSSR